MASLPAAGAGPVPQRAHSQRTRCPLAVPVQTAGLVGTTDFNSRLSAATDGDDMHWPAGVSSARRPTARRIPLQLLTALHGPLQTPIDPPERP